MYNLYFNKDKAELEITKVTEKHGKLFTEYTPEVTLYNICYYTCSDRKTLKEFANNLKEQWLDDAMERVELIKKIKV